MRVTYDKSVDAAYIELRDTSAGDCVHTEYATRDDQGMGGSINLDFDIDGKLIGIEVMVASMVLPEQLLAEAEIIG